MGIGGSWTVSEMLDDYLLDVRLRGIRRVNAIEYRASILRSHLGGIEAVAVDAAKIRDLQRRLAEGGYGNGSVNTIVSTLKTGLRLAADEGRIPRVPHFPRCLRNPPPRQGFLEFREYRAIREELPAWARDILSFAYLSGWRGCEILSLRWDEVDLGGSVIRLDPQRSKNLESRVLPIVGRFRAIIRRRRLLRNGCPTVFEREGAPVSERTYRYHFKLASERAERKGKLPHDCRRTAARDMERARVPRGIAMKLLGIKTESIYRRYAIVAEDELAGGAEKHHGYLRRRSRKKTLDT